MPNLITLKDSNNVQIREGDIIAQLHESCMEGLPENRHPDFNPKPYLREFRYQVRWSAEHSAYILFWNIPDTPAKRFYKFGYLGKMFEDPNIKSVHVIGTNP